MGETGEGGKGGWGTRIAAVDERRTQLRIRKGTRDKRERED